MDRKGTLGLEPEEIAELHSQHREGRARQNELQDELDYERDVLAGENGTFFRTLESLAGESL